MQSQPPSCASQTRYRKRRAATKLWEIGIVLVAGALGALLATTDRELHVPVERVASKQLVSTYGAPRSGGRKHAGIDIFAAKGTPVRAAGWGWVVGKTTLSLGGKVVFTFGEDGTLCYYAHLDDWAPDLYVGKWVTPDTVLGTVGQTGNARTTPPHLHFSARPWWTLFRTVDPVSLLTKPSRTGSTRRAGRISTASALDELLLPFADRQANSASDSVD